MSILDLFHADPVTMPTVHDIREWTIEHFFEDSEISTAYKIIGYTNYENGVLCLRSNVNTWPAWRRASANKTCWYELTPTTVKLWPNPRTHGDPPAVVFDLLELARLVLARKFNVHRETEAGQLEMEMI